MRKILMTKYWIICLSFFSINLSANEKAKSVTASYFQGKEIAGFYKSINSNNFVPVKIVSNLLSSDIDYDIEIKFLTDPGTIDVKLSEVYIADPLVAFEYAPAFQLGEMLSFRHSKEVVSVVAFSLVHSNVIVKKMNGHLMYQDAKNLTLPRGEKDKILTQPFVVRYSNGLSIELTPGQKVYMYTKYDETIELISDPEQFTAKNLNFLKTIPYESLYFGRPPHLKEEKLIWFSNHFIIGTNPFHNLELYNFADGDEFVAEYAIIDADNNKPLLIDNIIQTNHLRIGARVTGINVDKDLNKTYNVKNLVDNKTHVIHESASNGVLKNCDGLIHQLL
jgi:hypothetical protein